MEAEKLIQKDFKKWVIYNNTLNDFQSLYDLYSSIESKRSFGGVIFNKIISEEGSQYYVVQQGVESSLELNGESERKKLLEYLILHYFRSDDVEEWYKEKSQGHEKNKNHQIFSQPKNSSKELSPKNVKPHYKELRYYRLKVLFSAGFYLMALFGITFAFVISATNGFMLLFMGLTVVAFLAIAQRVVQGFFIGIIKGNSIKVTEHQYPEIYGIVKAQSEELGIKEVPEVYISAGHFNAFVTKLARKKYLMLYSEVIETSLKGNLDVVKFIVGHELGHLHRRHLAKDKWLFPSSFIPLLGYAYSRGCEYTCDRIGNAFSRQGALEGILILATGKEIYSKVNIEHYLKDSADPKSFWVWVSEKFLTHPHIGNRMKAIKEYNQRRG